LKFKARLWATSERTYDQGTKMSKCTGVLLLSAIALAGCDSYTSQQYQANPQNTIALQPIAASGRKANVASVQLAGNVPARPTCRLAGPIDIGGGNDAATVIKQAILTELLAAGVYRDNGTPISVLVTKLDPDTFAGTWSIAMTISTPKGSMNVERVSSFSTSFSGIAACNNTATAFNQALSLTILDAVRNPKFRSIL
jgi:hypothetical protein